jgi:putative nucleotidyltransferase with HDIG domain
MTMGTASGVTITQMVAMETAGFGESFEERTFFTGPSSTAEPVRLTRLQARKAAAVVMHAFVARGLETEVHCERVATWSRRLARELGLPSERVLDVEIGALLHDVGYINMKGIEFNKSTLSYSERFDLRRHCEEGAALLSRIPALRRAIPLVLSHHEEFDGTGYPRGQRDVDIPIDARIFHLVDAFESMTTDDPYRARMSDEEAREEIARCVGTRFDPVVHAAFSRIDVVEWRALVAGIR